MDVTGNPFKLQPKTSLIPWFLAGVSALRGLALRAAEEEDAPRLPVLLAEAFCAVYLALLGWSMAARDAHILYRLAAVNVDVKYHAKLFGGGVRRLLTTAPAQPQVSKFNTDTLYCRQELIHKQTKDRVQPAALLLSILQSLSGNLRVT